MRAHKGDGKRWPKMEQKNPSEPREESISKWGIVNCLMQER